MGASARGGIHGLVLVAFGLASFPVAVFAQQALPLTEPFDYASGSLVGQGGWTQSGTANQNPVQIVGGSLTYSDFPGAIGGKVALSNGVNYQSVGLDFQGQNSGTVYASFLLRVINPGNTSGDYFFRFSSAGAGAQDFRVRVFVRQASGGQFHVGLANANTQTPVWTGASYTVGVTHLVVAAYAFGPDVGDDMTYVWINPPLGASLPPSPDLSAAVPQELTMLGRVGWRQGAGDSTLALEVDELRVAPTWSAVTPAASRVTDWPLFDMP